MAPESLGARRLPITAEVMKLIHDVLFSASSTLSHRDEFSRLMLWAACCVGYFGFMQSGEFTVCRANQGDTISITDVAVDSHTSPSAVRILLQRTKTDPFWKGVFIFLGKTSSVVRPVTASLHFLSIRQACNETLFVWRDGSPLSHHRFVQEFRVILQAAGLDQSRYAGHSFRIGAATSAARAGIPAHLIKMLGRWESEAYLLYVRTPCQDLVQVSPLLAPPN